MSFTKASDDESRDMVDYAEELFDSGWQEEAQEIALCLGGILPSHLIPRRAINEEELVSLHPTLFTSCAA